MSAIALQVFESLVADGMGETQARAVAKATDATIADARKLAAEFAELDKKVATRADIAATNSKIEAGNAKLDAKIDAGNAKLNAKMEAIVEKMAKDGLATRERIAGWEGEMRVLNRIILGLAIMAGGTFLAIGVRIAMFGFS